MAHELTDDMIDAALAKGAVERAKAPVASSVSYDRKTKRIVVDFENGAALLIPAKILQGLESASDDAIAEVELERGYALHWERLDVDFTIPGLMAGVFGTARYMAANAGRITSEAKAAAARENGKKGGRPRKFYGKAGEIIAVLVKDRKAYSTATRVVRESDTGQFFVKKYFNRKEGQQQESFDTMPVPAIRKDAAKD